MINKDELIYKINAIIDYLKNNKDMIINCTINYVRVMENQIQILLNMQKMF